MDTSFQLLYSGSEESEALLSKLFYDYIGYKFDSLEKKTKLDNLITQTHTIVSQEFQPYLKVEKSTIHGYTLDFRHKETVHHSLVGSIENNENIARAFLNVPLQVKEKRYYDFLNIKGRIAHESIENQKKLEKIIYVATSMQLMTILMMIYIFVRLRIC